MLRANYWPCLLLAVLCVAPHDLRSAEAPTRLIALNRPTGSGVPTLVDCFHGDAVDMPATFLVTAGQVPRIAADIFLDGDELGAPLIMAVPFQAAAAPSHPSLLEGTFHLPLPDTGKPILLRVQVRLAAHEDAAPAALAQIRLRVTPRTELKKALARLTDPARRGPELRLAVFGKLLGLRELLREWKIPFDEEGLEMPVRLGAHTLGVGEAQHSLHLPRTGANSTLLLIHHDLAADAGLFEKSTPDGILATLNIPHQEDWRLSPFLHRQLISKINQHLRDHD